MSAPSKESLLESFVPGSSFPIRETMLKIYGYGLTSPEFVDMALECLEVLGCESAREIYENVVNEWETEHDAMLKRAADWYVGWCDQDEKHKSRKDGELSRQLQTMSKRDLKKLYQRLKAKKIVEDPDQFAEMVILYL